MMTNSELSRSKSVRFSNLKAMWKSPAHYLAQITREREDTRAMRIGRGVHAMVLGGEFDHFPGKDRRSAGFAAFEKAAKSETVLTDGEFYECKRIADAVLAEPEAMSALSGVRENLLTTAIDGRPIRGTPDAFNLKTGVLADLKTTICADVDAFSRDAVNRLYVNQLAWYRMLVRYETGAFLNTFRLVAVENSAPYCVSVINVPLDMVETAATENLDMFRRLLECEERNEFPGYTHGRVVELTRPRSKTDYNVLTEIIETTESEAA